MLNANRIDVIRGNKNSRHEKPDWPVSAAPVIAPEPAARHHSDARGREPSRVISS